MKFIDYAKVTVTSGNGGKGCVSFRREKYVPRGGPDGGDGGKGADVIFLASSELNTLLDFRYKRQYRAARGGNGKGKNMHGRNGQDLVIPVPVGTLIRDDGSGELLSDLVSAGQTVVAAKGGRGGLGNAHFKTATRQVPRFAQPGEEGEERVLILELKLLADVGLVGLPNAGKSTLISAISAARPKIADYPFTTLVPHLGVVKAGDYRSFVVADIPGLIEGAHKGAGLGIQFLRHIERTRILLHLVDVSGTDHEDPVQRYLKVNKELALYRRDLVNKRIVVAATKIDLLQDDRNISMMERFCADNNLHFLKISAVTGRGIRDLVNYLAGEITRSDETTRH